MTHVISSKRFHYSFLKKMKYYLDNFETKLGHQRYYYLYKMFITLEQNQNIINKSNLYYRWRDFMWTTYYKSLEFIKVLSSEYTNFQHLRKPQHNKHFLQLILKIKKYRRRMERIIVEEYSKLPGQLPLEIRTHIISFLALGKDGKSILNCS